MKLPDRIFGISTSEAYKKYLEESKKKPKNEDQIPKAGEITTSITGINLGDYIFLPRHNIYVAKEKTHLGKDWNQAHEELHKERARMLTIREFVDFLLFLRSGNVQDGLGNIVTGPDVQSVYNEITEVRSPWRAEWIDAYFSQQPNASILNISYNHRIVNGKLQPQNTESLEQHLTEDKVPGIDLVDWLSRANKQGLPPSDVKSGSLYYWHPKNGRVARFRADSGRAFLSCLGVPSYSDSSLGVRVVRDKV